MPQMMGKACTAPHRGHNGARAIESLDVTGGLRARLDDAEGRARGRSSGLPGA